MNEIEASHGPARAISATTIPTRESSPAGGSGYCTRRRFSNWAWATLRAKYDWMDSHTLSGEV